MTLENLQKLWFDNIGEKNSETSIRNSAQKHKKDDCDIGLSGGELNPGLERI